VLKAKQAGFFYDDDDDGDDDDIKNAPPTY
jgi:hypothetical protein